MSLAGTWGWMRQGTSATPAPPFPFPAANMARLAADVFPCGVELLSGGLEGQNHKRILQHLSAGRPVLIPYPAFWDLAARCGMLGGDACILSCSLILLVVGGQDPASAGHWITGPSP